jgi:hypothetical protein
MKIAFKNAEIYDMAKITHQRTMAIQYGASRGLNSPQIASFTKHRTDTTLLLHTGMQSWFWCTQPRYVESEHITFPDG